MRSGQHRNPLETRRYLDALRAMMAYFAWIAATTDRWNSFDWRMFLAGIHGCSFVLLLVLDPTGLSTVAFRAAR